MKRFFLKKKCLFKKKPFLNCLKKKYILFSVQNLNIKIASSPNDHFYFKFFLKTTIHFNFNGKKLLAKINYLNQNGRKTYVSISVILNSAILIQF